MQPLEERIAGWRREMLRSADSEVVEEIEGHLREAIAKRRAEGLSEHEAFFASVKELGSGEEISAEYKRLPDATWWAVKVAIGAGGVVLLCACAILFGRLTERQFGWWLATHVAAVTCGYVGVLITGALGIAYVVERCFWDFDGRRLRSAARATANFAAGSAIFTTIGIGLAMVWAKLAWGRYWAWDSKETGSFGILVWLILFASMARSGLLPARATMLLAIFGNMVVSFGWFGSNGASWFGILLGSVLFHLAFLAIGFLPSRCLTSGGDGSRQIR